MCVEVVTVRGGLIKNWPEVGGRMAVIEREIEVGLRCIHVWREYTKQNGCQEQNPVAIVNLGMALTVYQTLSVR